MLMPYLLRKVAQARWYKDPARTWLAPDEPPADALTDLKAEACKISVYRVDDSFSNLEAVLAGLAAATTRADKFDYMLLPETTVEALGVRRSATPGKTPSSLANACHVDLVELSAAKVLDVAREMYRTVKPVRKSKREVAELVKSAVAAGVVDRTQLNDAWAQEIRG